MKIAGLVFLLFLVSCSEEIPSCSGGGDVGNNYILSDEFVPLKCYEQGLECGCVQGNYRDIDRTEQCACLVDDVCEQLNWSDYAYCDVVANEVIHSECDGTIISATKCDPENLCECKSPNFCKCS